MGTEIKLMDSEELWKSISGYSGYLISTHGKIWSKRKKRLMRSHQRKNGYRQITLYSKRLGKDYFYIHQLVLLTFLGRRPEGLETAHLDGDPGNNYLNNLIYTSPSKNNQMKHIHGTVPLGEKNSRAKLTEENVLTIRSEYKFGSSKYGMDALAEKYNVAKSTIYFLIHRKTWQHI